MDSHELPEPPFSWQQLNSLFPDNMNETLQNIFASFFFWLQIVSLFASLFIILGIIYSVVRINHIRKKERERFANAVTPVSANPEGGRAPEVNARWKHVLELSDSDSEQDWRMAIIEADIMLDEMMTRMQYDGETLGEKLKTVELSDFNTIDSAWQAHKVRNQIAHSGSDFVLSKREARRTIELYKSVFEEFHFI